MTKRNYYKKNKNIMVVVPWINTRNNHSGMFYFAKHLSNMINAKLILQKNQTNYWYKRIYTIITSVLIALKINIHAKKMGNVLLMEYLLPSVSQHIIAFILKKIRKDLRLIGIVHLAPNHLKEKYNYNEDKIKKHLSYLDEVIVFGSTLKKYIEKFVNKKYIHHVLHYVDNSYYGKIPTKQKNEKLNILFQGNLKRSVGILYELIESFNNSNEVHFHIMSGLNNYERFNKFRNVTIYPFVNEEELRGIMFNSQVSLNIMEDTIGSNVITTSMSSGLAMIVTDVGSIRDYLDDNSSILCTSLKEYKKAIDTLINDQEMLYRLQLSSHKKSLDIEINNISNNFIKILNDKFNKQYNE